MPDINFLPKEDMPKHPPAPNRERVAVEFYNPAAEEKSLKRPVPKLNRLSKISGIFKFLFNLFNREKNDNLAPRDLSATFGRAGFDLKSNRENLLKQIKSGSAAPEKIAPEIKPHAFPQSNKPRKKINFTLFARALKFLARGRTSVAETPGIPEGAGIKFKEIKEVKAAPAKKELNINLADGSAPIKSAPLKNKKSFYGFILDWFKLKFKTGKLKPETIKPKQASAQLSAETKRAPAPPVFPSAPIAPPAPIAHAPEVKANANRENSLETNLIKGNDFIFFNWRRAGRINIIAIVFCLVIIGGGWGYLSWLENQRAVSSEINKDLLAKEEQQKKLAEEADKLSGLRAKTAEVKKLLAKHVYWTDFFNWLEKNTLAGVYYESFAGDAAGEYVLPALARDFKIFGAQMKAWQEEKIFTISAKTTKAEVKTRRNNAGPAAAEEQNISFDVNLAVKPEIFNQR